MASTSSSSNGRGRVRVETIKTTTADKLVPNPAKAKRELEKLAQVKERNDPDRRGFRRP